MSFELDSVPGQAKEAESRRTCRGGFANPPFHMTAHCLLITVN